VRKKGETRKHVVVPKEAEAKGGRLEIRGKRSEEPVKRWPLSSESRAALAMDFEKRRDKSKRSPETGDVAQGVSYKGGVMPRIPPSISGAFCGRMARRWANSFTASEI